MSLATGSSSSRSGCRYVRKSGSFTLINRIITGQATPAQRREFDDRSLTDKDFQRDMTNQIKRWTNEGQVDKITALINAMEDLTSSGESSKRDPQIAGRCAPRPTATSVGGMRWPGRETAHRGSSSSLASTAAQQTGSPSTPRTPWNRSQGFLDFRSPSLASSVGDSSRLGDIDLNEAEGLADILADTRISASRPTGRRTSNASVSSSQSHNEPAIYTGTIGPSRPPGVLKVRGAAGSRTDSGEGGNGRRASQASTKSPPNLPPWK
ncbi:hypothetical protein GJ744_011416 [Endocarpon pusillum]|uniref:Uncharacterized protein n=1 Tax=Endocarpon pusillum TaxID=364733 RepID=A0A8H7AEX3_9EURO|nr:hypothetical protein GJ744_011416 [Endocarpon pusillum]